MVAKNMVKAVGYARRSTDMQERSIPDQKAFVQRWAEENGYTILRWYTDDAISGTSAKGREAFERMIHQAENGCDFEVVLVYDISRFSRGGTNETGYFLYRLQQAGVRVVFCAESLPDDEGGELLLGVKSWQARQYSVKLSRDSIRGTISMLMERRSAPGGVPPFGYDKQHVTADGQILRTFRWLPDGRKQEFDAQGRLARVLAPGETVKKAKSDIVRYVPSTPQRVAVVRRVFAQCAQGYGYRFIAARLNDEGIPSADGKKWNANRIKRMVENPVYRGALAWNKRTMGKLHGVGRDGRLRPRRGTYQTKNNPVEDWYVVEGVHEPLVSPEEFEKARQAVAKRRSAGGLARPTNRSLLSGLIVCKRCGWRFGQRHTNYTFQGNRTRYRYYIDRGYHMGGKAVCKLTSIPADALDAWVVGKVKDVLLGDHEAADTAIDAFVKQVLAGLQCRADTADLQRDLDAVNKRIKAAVAMLADPAFDGLDELKATLADLKAKRDALQSRLAKATPDAAPPPKESDLRAWAIERLRQLDRLLAGRASTLEARRLVHAYVDRIEVDPDRRRGVLYLPADAYALFARETSTRATRGSWRATPKSW